MELFFGANRGAKGVALVVWDICTLPKDQGGLGLLDIRAQGAVFEVIVGAHSRGGCSFASIGLALDFGGLTHSG